MTVSVVTSCSAAGWEQYGQRFVESFDKFWPPEVALYVVSEDNLPVASVKRMFTFEKVTRRITFIDLNSSAQFTEFSKRHASNPRAHGVRVLPVIPTIKDKHHGYNFRMDAVKFSKKVFAIGMVADLVTGRLIWLDADVVTIDSVPYDFLATLPPVNYAIAYLDRKPYHSECGFVSYDLEHPAVRYFISKFVAAYATDSVFKLKEWNDCFAFDYLRVEMNVPSYPIPHKSTTHPFVHSVLGRYMDHLKGMRKQKGVSHDHPRLTARLKGIKV